MTDALNKAEEYSQTAVRGIKVNGTSISCDSNNIVNIVTADNDIPTVEKGIWTPTFICLGGTNPTYVFESANSQYYRIGELVYITFYIHANITNAGSGKAYIGGLPFAGRSNTDRQAISLSLRGSFSANTVLSVAQGQKILRIGINEGSNQSWSTGSIYIGGSGCYLRS